MVQSTKKQCSIDGCNRKVKSRGWCQSHYNRWYRYGVADQPLKVPHASSPDEALKMRTVKQGNCLIWTGAKDQKGYGKIGVDGKIRRVHHFTWEKKHGPIPDGMQIDHTCWNTSCHNVDHLRLATPSQNKSYLRKTGKRTKTGVRNVGWRDNKYVVRVGKDRKLHYFGAYDTLDEAAEVAKQARKDLFGEFAGFDVYDTTGSTEGK